MIFSSLYDYFIQFWIESFLFFYLSPIHQSLRHVLWTDKIELFFFKITPFLTRHNGKNDKTQATKKPR